MNDTPQLIKVSDQKQLFLYKAVAMTTYPAGQVSVRYDIRKRVHEDNSYVAIQWFSDIRPSYFTPHVTFISMERGVIPGM